VSRLSRSTQQLCQIIDIIKGKRLCLVIVGSITIDCRNGEIDPMSSAFLKMSGVFAELELQMIRARVKSGMENAKAKGKRIGRPETTVDDIPAIFFRHYPAYSSGTLNKAEFARVCDLSRPTIDKYLRIVSEGK
jgi:DNA invertase Pin-like site-specific DNA recombinase